MIADLYATSTCNPGFNVRCFLCPYLQPADQLKWTASPACTELEAIVMDWAAQLLGLSPAFMNASGIGGGSIQVLKMSLLLQTTSELLDRALPQILPSLLLSQLAPYTCETIPTQVWKIWSFIQRPRPTLLG